MERASSSEIQKRKSAQLVKGELLSSFFAAAIPVFNAFFYWHNGKKIATIAKDYNSVRRTYSIFGWILLLLPFVILQCFMFLGSFPSIYFLLYNFATPLFWLCYLTPVFLIAKKHTSIVKDLGELQVDN